MNNDMWWMLLLLLIAGSPGTMEKLEADLENRKKALEQRDMCPHVEWEQDMGAHIPFCQLDGEFCNMQCMKGWQKNDSN